MQPYFEYTDRDRAFYQVHIQAEIPQEIYDVHTHINLPEHVETVPGERLESDWALECGHILPARDAYRCANELFPDTVYRIAGFPWPIREADLHGNNRYLADMRKKGLIDPFMVVKPEWDPEEVEKTLVEGGFFGFKPYPDMVSGMKGVDISIFDFFPHAQWEILDRHKKIVMLHIPRRNRFADDANVSELLDARQRYPDVRIILAHFGRSFCAYYLKEGLRKLGEERGFYFDTSAVSNPEVYEFAFNFIPLERILYGSDMPITFWRGKQEWTEREYTVLSSGDYSWNTKRRSPEEEASYTIYIYEEMRALLYSAKRLGIGEAARKDIFFGNAVRLLGPHSDHTTFWSEHSGQI
jgi:predicted TIM-barrel fold metal-dependent hydrolase